MKMVFRLLFLILFFYQFSTKACELKEPLVSLSGPFTTLLQEFDLLADKNLIAISAFHPISKKTNAEILAGGIFLSHKYLKKYKDINVYFDKSSELRQSFKKAGLKKSLEINSVGIDNFLLIKNLITILRDKTNGCEEKFKLLETKLTTIRSSLLNWQHKKIVFFLGEIKMKLPELVMVNDGVMLYLKQNELVQTYPSELAYVNWSQKELNQLDDYTFIGISESQNDNPKLEKISDKKWNIFYKGALTPGITQIQFLYFLNSVKL